MKIKYLGTAAAEGIPAVFCACELCSKVRKKGSEKDFRARSQMLINDRLVVDFGPDAYSNSVKHGVDYSKISSYLITHSHSDHFDAPEFEYFVQGFAYNTASDKIYIYGNKAVVDKMKESFNFDPQIFILKVLEKYKSTVIEDMEITPLPAAHMTGVEDAFIYLIEDKTGALLYGNDTGKISDEVFEFLKKKKKNIDILSLDCTKGSFERDYYSHMSLSENNAVKERLIADGVCDDSVMAISTHFSHNCAETHAELCKKAKKYDIIIAYDGMTVYKY